MGRIIKEKVELIEEAPDRYANRIVLEKAEGEYHLHFRNLKVLLSEEEFENWRRGLAEAKKKFLENDYFKNDIP